MASLASKFKTDSTIANEGVWFKLAQYPNEDGTIPAFKMARIGAQNKAYAKAVKRAGEKFVDADGEFDKDALTDEQQDELDLDVFVSTILLGWDNFQPNEDGKAVPYSAEKAREIFGNYDWIDLLRFLTKKAKEVTAWKARERKADVKN